MRFFALWWANFLFASSVPSAPIFHQDCEARIKTEEICITWLKPEGGNKIDNYIVQWIVENNMNYSDTIFYNGMRSKSYILKHLQAGQTVNVSIRANNSAGEGEAFSKIYATSRSFLFPVLLLLILLVFRSVYNPWPHSGF